MFLDFQNFQHRGCISKKKFYQVCGEHFNKAGHSQSDKLIIILEQATPKNDVFLRIKQDEFWIRNYQLVEFGFRNLPVSVPTDLVK